MDPAGGDALAAELADDGHVVARAPEALPAATPPDAVVVCLDADPRRTLDAAARIAASNRVQADAMLFVGGTPAALQEAERRFPRASFARLDALRTAIASLEG